MKRGFDMDMKNGKNDKKHAFSIAEAMVMLVVVSIIMAVSAPLIAKRSVADSKRIFGMNGGNITGALGANQKLLLGKNAPTNADAKLDVNGLLMANQFGVNGNSLEISNSDDYILFSINSDGVTNLETSSYNAGSSGDSNTEHNGYLFITDAYEELNDTPTDPGSRGSIHASLLNESNENIIKMPYMVSYKTDCVSSSCTSTKVYNGIHMPMLVPFSKGNIATCNSSNCVKIYTTQKADNKSAKRTGSGSGSSQQTGGDNQGGNSTQ